MDKLLETLGTVSMGLSLTITELFARYPELRVTFCAAVLIVAHSISKKI